MIFYLVCFDNFEIFLQTTCKIMTVTMHYFFLAVFCWMLCQGILIYLMLVVVFDSGKSYSRRFFALGWGICFEVQLSVCPCQYVCRSLSVHPCRCFYHPTLAIALNCFIHIGLPAVIVAVSFGARFDEYGSYEYCFLTYHMGLIYAFVGPMAAIILVNLFTFIIALRLAISRTYADKGSKAAAQTALRATAVLLPVLGLTWVVGVFAVDSLSVILAYIFTIFNSLQGFFVLIFHCLLDKGVQRAFRKSRKKWSPSSSAFLGGSSTGTTGKKSTTGMSMKSSTVESYSMSTVNNETSLQVGGEGYLASTENSSTVKEALKRVYRLLICFTALC
jgi:G protein-coupled receptor 133